MKRTLPAFIIGCIVVILLDFAHLRHGQRVLESWWGFYGIFAFCTCVALVYIAKLLQWLLHRPSEYYNRRPHD